MPTQLPRVPSLIPSSFATLAIGRDVSITIFTASSLNSGEKLFLGRDNYFTFPDSPSYWMDCPEGSGHLIYCLVDLIRAPSVRYLPKPVWALIIVFVSAPFGALA